MEYLFYRLWQLLYRISKNPNKDDEVPFGAMMMLILIQGANLATLDVILHHFIDFGFHLRNKNEVILCSLITASILIIFNIFYLFIRRNTIELKYKNESNLRKKIGNIILIAYGILSFIILVIFGKAYPIN